MSSLGLLLSLSGITLLNVLLLTLIAVKVSSSGFSLVVIATYFTSSSALIVFCFTAAKDSNITSYTSLYLSSKTILLHSIPSTTSILLLLKAPCGGGPYKYCRSLFTLTISILIHNY